MEIEIGIKFVISRSTNGKFGVQIVAVDPEGRRLGPPVGFIDAIFASPAEAGDAVLGTFRGALHGRQGCWKHDELGIGQAIDQSRAAVT